MGSTFQDIAHNTGEMSPLFKEGYEGNTATQSNYATSGIRLKPESELEKLAGKDISGQYDILKQFLASGPGQSSIDASNRDQQSFVDLMRQINASGGMPTAEDTRQANVYADQLFKPQQEALNQSFEFAQRDAAKLAAKLNRPINDPIIQSKLLQDKMRQESMMSANRSAFVAQEARNSPFQRLQLQGQLADAQSSLASQAMSNRMQLLNLGNALQAQERNWRLQTSEKYANQNASQHSGGGLLGGIGAMNSGIGSTMSAVGGIMSLGSMGGGAGGTSTAQQQQVQGGGMNTASAFGGFMSPGGYNSQYLGTGMGTAPVSSYSPAPARTSRINYTGMGSLNYQSPQPNYPWGSGIR